MTRLKKPPDKLKIKKYQNYLTSYKCIKTSLKSIVKNRSTLETINKIVCRMNKIVIHTYQFLKLYCIKQFNNNNSIPTIDRQFVVLIMKTICESDGTGRKFSNTSQIILNKLEMFYDDIYEPLMLEKRRLTYTNLGNLLEYEANSIVTCLQIFKISVLKTAIINTSY